VDDEVGGTVITTTTLGDEVDAVDVLPFTGSNSEALLVLAVSALALGGLLVMSARREEG
jgi:LPXTG-motif cell wall-anchored protein